VAALLGLVVTGPVRADDYVVVRGGYYREASTRVIQPMVEVERDSPETGIDIDAHFLVDAITSASASAGVGVDSIFTELRDEAALRLRKRWDRRELTLGYKYSTESDYWSHAIGASFAWRLWGDTARLTLSSAVNFDTLTARGRTPYCADPGKFSCSLNGYYGGVIYSQVLSPVLLVQGSAESMLLDGFQGNVYRSVPNLGYERLPDKRVRNALSARVARYFPRTSTGLQLQYRFYGDYYPGTSPSGQDPWHLAGHMIELRVFQKLTRDLEVRLSYRQYIQNDAANFWCDAIAQTDCYSGPQAIFYSTDPKLGRQNTEYPEIKLYWEAARLADVPFFRWFSAGTFEISYGRYFQNDSFGPAHVLQMGYRMPY
jgi:hypothetical protein